jgi:hypothetical protein
MDNSFKYFIIFYLFAGMMITGITSVFPSDCSVNTEITIEQPTGWDWIFGGWTTLLGILSFGLSNMCDVPIALIAVVELINTAFAIFGLLYIWEWIRGIGK